MALTFLYEQRTQTGDFLLCCAGGACCETDSCQKVHRCVLAAASPVFLAMLYGPMKEGASSHEVCSLIPDAETLSTVVKICYGFPQESATLAVCAATRALQLEITLPANIKPCEEWPSLLWEVYARTTILSTRCINFLIKKRDSSLVPLLSEYNLNGDQVCAIEGFTPMSELFTLYRTSATQTGKKQTPVPMCKGSRIVYDGTSYGGDAPPAGSRGTIIDLDEEEDGDVRIRFDEGVRCVPNPYRTKIKNCIHEDDIPDFTI